MCSDSVNQLHYNITVSPCTQHPVGSQIHSFICSLIYSVFSEHLLWAQSCSRRFEFISEPNTNLSPRAEVLVIIGGMVTLVKVRRRQIGVCNGLHLCLPQDHTQVSSSQGSLSCGRCWTCAMGFHDSLAQVLWDGRALSPSEQEALSHTDPSWQSRSPSSPCR